MLNTVFKLLKLPALATGLAQGPVRDGGTGTHWSLPTGSGLPSPYRAPGLGHPSTLPRRRRNGRASGVPVSGPRSRQEGHLARRHLHNRPATPLELPGTDWGGDPPSRPGMRERESCSTWPAMMEVNRFRNCPIARSTQCFYVPLFSAWPCTAAVLMMGVMLMKPMLLIRPM